MKTSLYYKAGMVFQGEGSKTCNNHMAVVGLDQHGSKDFPIPNTSNKQGLHGDGVGLIGLVVGTRDKCEIKWAMRSSIEY